MKNCFRYYLFFSKVITNSVAEMAKKRQKRHAGWKTEEKQLNY